MHNRYFIAAMAAAVAVADPTQEQIDQASAVAEATNNLIQGTP